MWLPLLLLATQAPQPLPPSSPAATGRGAGGQETQHGTPPLPEASTELQEGRLTPELCEGFCAIVGPFLALLLQSACFVTVIIDPWLLASPPPELVCPVSTVSMKIQFHF